MSYPRILIKRGNITGQSGVTWENNELKQMMTGEMVLDLLPENVRRVFIKTGTHTNGGNIYQALNPALHTNEGLSFAHNMEELQNGGNVHYGYELYLNVASTTELGGIKVGNGLIISKSGVLSVIGGGSGVDITGFSTQAITGGQSISLLYYQNETGMSKTFELVAGTGVSIVEVSGTPGIPKIQISATGGSFTFGDAIGEIGGWHGCESPAPSALNGSASTVARSDHRHVLRSASHTTIGGIMVDNYVFGMGTGEGPIKGIDPGGGEPGTYGCHLELLLVDGGEFGGSFTEHGFIPENPMEEAIEEEPLSSPPEEGGEEPTIPEE
jgi:hypothetical protein